ncbi:MAG: GNAT family N-acetyltransferase [Chloroflexota bacterium]|nr:GNAT family N-acetyltransferase [Chloroflexota bacterium]MDE2685131.1 GNAT family N-acetyltransferase [Chloroflexota bacterium]
MELVDDPTDTQAGEIERGLDDYNATVASARSTTAIKAVFVDSGRVVAGITGAAYWGKLHIRILWVHPDYQSKGLGSRLMDWVEKRGRELRCTSALVDTMSFQAPAFYERRGYRRFGVSECYEGGASRYYFEKEL